MRARRRAGPVIVPSAVRGPPARPPAVRLGVSVRISEAPTSRLEHCQSCAQPHYHTRHRASSEGSGCFAEHDLVVDAQPAEAIQRGEKKAWGNRLFQACRRLQGTCGHGRRRNTARRTASRTPWRRVPAASNAATIPTGFPHWRVTCVRVWSEVVKRRAGLAAGPSCHGARPQAVAAMFGTLRPSVTPVSRVCVCPPACATTPRHKAAKWARKKRPKKVRRPPKRAANL